MADRAAVVNRFGKRQTIMDDDDDDGKEDQMPIRRNHRRPFRQAQMPPKAREYVNFFEPDEGSNPQLTFFLALHQMHSHTDISPWQLCSYYATMLSAFLPGTRLPVETLLNSKGVYLREVKIPSEARNAGVDTNIEYPPPRSIGLLYLGCAILILFKNLSPQNYEPFMSKRVNALKSMLGGVLWDGTLKNPLTVNEAAIIRSKLGFSIEVKGQLIQLILQNRCSRTLFGNMCLYLARILAWSDMQVFAFIKNTLVRYDSPVLKDPSVRGEVRNLEETLEAMDATPYPEFFRFICRPDQQHLLHRSRVRVLAETAFAISKLDWTDNSSRDNFGTTAMPSDRELIKRLVNLHTEYIASGTDPVFTSAIEFFRDYDS